MAPVRCGFWRASPDSPQPPSSSPQASPTKPLTPQPASDGTHSQPGLPRAPSQGVIPQSGAHLLPAKSTDARPPKHKRSGSGSKAFQGPFSYNPDVLLSPVEPFIAQVCSWYPVLQNLCTDDSACGIQQEAMLQIPTRSHVLDCSVSGRKVKQGVTAACKLLCKLNVSSCIRCLLT